MPSEREPIAVIGTGYVGLVTAAGFADLGNEVWCVDVDAEKIAALKRGELPIYEPGLADCVEKHRDRLHFGTELAPALEHARLLFVAVGTPPTYSGDADLSAVHAVVDAMPRSDHHALVMKSTVPVGTGASIKRSLTARGITGRNASDVPAGETVMPLPTPSRGSGSRRRGRSRSGPVPHPRRSASAAAS